jgi:sialate O-acetylesterase
MIILHCIRTNVHPRTKLDVGYRLSRSGLAIAYGRTNITYQGPIISEISTAADSHQINVLRNPNGFEVCCLGKQICTANETIWVPTPASTIQGAPLTIALSVPPSCVGKPIDGLRYLWRETPCLFKQAAIYSTLDSNLPAPPYIEFF